MHVLRPGPLFNPLTAAEPLSPVAVLAGPYGLIAFLPLVPLVVLAARRWPRAALAGGGLVWLMVTLRPLATAILLGWVAAGSAWVLLLAALRRRSTAETAAVHGRRLGRRGMSALVWIGLHVLALPLWWQARQWWYEPLSPLAALHQIGPAYFLLRLVAWGVSLANEPGQPLRLLDTVCWLLYPPCMRLGPVLRREEFLARLDAWQPRAARWGDLRAGLKRIGLFLLGGTGVGVLGAQLQQLARRGDFFSRPETFTTGELVALFYLVPVQIYLLLWTYNELAVALSHWVGIRVDDNFHRLPAATSVRDFWRRWHITVGSWLRDHIYFPLGGGRRRATLNLFAVFLYCGIWHGASWSFLAWGASQAAALAVQRAWDRRWRERGRPAPSGRWWTFVCWLLTMHYQAATIVMFADFDHLGLRLAWELLRRV